MSQVFDYVCNAIKGNYDLGCLVRAKLIERGYVNVSYELETVRDGQTRRYVLRRYRNGTTLDQIRFEHALLAELERKKFDLTPVVIPTGTGETYAECAAPPSDKGQRSTYMSLFSFIEGEDKYSWDHPQCEESELADAGRVLATYHQAVQEWIPSGSWRRPRLIDLPKTLSATWAGLGGESARSVFDEYFIAHKAILLNIAAKLEESLPRGSYNALPHLAIHGDYHPANLKFSLEKIVGLLDFGWANIDARCFDVTLAIIYFCSPWGGDLDGILDTDKVTFFLDSYQKAVSDDQSPDLPGPLNESELSWVPDIMQAGNLYILNWVVSEYYTTSPDPDEYVRYLKHNTRLAQWLEAKSQGLSDLVAKHQIKSRSFG